MRRARTSLLLLALAATLLVSPTAVSADLFDPAALLSGTATEQAIDARDPAVSSDGHFVTFDGDYGGLTGVWRRAVGAGVIEPVAVGAPSTPQGSAVLPSISADGRYVSFTTTARLDLLDDTNTGPDVYVRDMSNPHSEPCQGQSEACAYTLASASDGSSAGLSYSYGSNPLVEEPAYGSIASGRSALSANGQQVAFVTTAISDLAGSGTPALQVAVRDISRQTTRLVSVRYDPVSGGPAVDPATGQPEPVAAQEGTETYGAVFTGAGAHAPGFRALQPREAPTPVGASISADGTTVAWMGTNVALQAQMLSGESQPPKYTEPLWRRIADGPQAPIRRITGGSDPTSQACLESHETVLQRPPSLADPCQGPLSTLVAPATPGVVSGLEGNDDVIPRLSADGYTVAFLSNAPPVALGEGFGQGGAAHADLYVADMHAGLTRDQALRALTEPASGDATDIATTAPIIDVGISPDASEIAFTTKRTQFPLGSPAYVNAPSGAAGMLELFDVDLATDSLTRVTQGFEGGPSEHPHQQTPAGEDPYPSAGDGALSPSFSGDGNTLVFGSTASNLVYGDGNTPPADEPFGAFDGSDVFAVARVLFSSASAPQDLGPPPADPAPVPSWLLGVTAVSRRDGSVLLEADVPGSGRLGASARGSVILRGVVSARRARRSRARTATYVASMTLASAAGQASSAGLVGMQLKLAKRFTSLAAKPGGLSAIVNVTFTSPKHATLRQQLQVTFVRRPVRRSGGTATRRRGHRG